MPAAARITDNAQHDGPHCHAPMHPPAPTPTPMPHPPTPLALMLNGSPTVMINSMQAATATTQTKPCTIPGCAPGGPGLVSMGSMTVMINMKPAARANDLVAFAACVGPIPMPTGKIMPPCSPTVMIGG